MTTQVEPEWDDETRNLAEGLDMHERQSCPGCGLHESITSDPDAAFTFEERTCPVCQGQDGYARILAERDNKWHEHNQNVSAAARQPSDGRMVFMRPMSPDEVEARKQN